MADSQADVDTAVQSQDNAANNVPATQVNYDI